MAGEETSWKVQVDESVRAVLEESVATQQALISQVVELKKLIVNLTHRPMSADYRSEEEEGCDNDEIGKGLENLSIDASSSEPGLEISQNKESVEPTSPPTWKYDVFVSFRGEDTRRGFASHLFHALKSADINCYRDIDRDSRGQVVGPMLIDAIHHSMMSIILFSKNYADSKWCLQELVEILSCNDRYRAHGHTILPIFYDVEPTEVRNQSGQVGKALKRCRAKNKQEKEAWRNALEKAGNVSSWHLTNDANGDEAGLIEQIVEELLRRVFYSRSPYFVTSAVGRNNNVKHLISLLKIDDGSCRIRTVGIYGAEGIGKTALAKITCSQVYNKFNGSISLLENIHDNSSLQEGGVVLLQNKLVKDVLKIKRTSILSEDRIRNVGEIRKRLYQKKALLVLDNIEEPQEMFSIFGRDAEKFLNPGSRILIITKNKELLDQLNVDAMYMVPALDHQDSLNLFYHHALVDEEEDSTSTTEYEELSKNLIHYAGGFPLGIQTLASFLSDKPKDAWQHMLEKLVRSPRLDSVGIRLKSSVFPQYDRIVDPIGGTGHFQFDDGRNTDVLKVRINVSSKISVLLSIQVQYDRNGSSILSCAHGGAQNPDKGTWHSFALDHPEEYLISISGTITEMVNFGAVESIKFQSNKRTYGPYGNEQHGTAFTIPQIDGGKIIGFYGQCDTYYLDSIGVHFGPISDPSPFFSNGPFGGDDGAQTNWDDGKHLDVRQIDLVVDQSSGIKSIHTTYDNYGHPNPIAHGSTTTGTAPKQVKLDYPYEYLRAISGYMGETEGSTDGVLRSIAFHSNTKTYGPFGDEVGRPFCTQPSGAKIVGFFGASDCSKLGVHLQPVSHLHPRKRIVGPIGSQQGTVWDHGEYSDITKIFITLGHNGIAFLSCEYNNNDLLIGDPTPPNLFKQVKVVKLNYPNEYIKSMSGSYMQYSNGMTTVTSLTFDTNLATYGPYGLSNTEKDTCFMTPINIGKIVGFYGTNNGNYVESIGAYFAPVYHVSPLVKIGPFGDYYLNTWDDEKHNGVKKIVVTYASVIDGLSFTYVGNYGRTVEGKFHGNKGPVVQVINLDYPNEYLVGMSGYIGFLGEYACIRSLKFETNLNREFGPYGSQEGIYFSFKSTIAKIVGFHGSINSWYLNSIGPYLQIL